MDAMYEIMWENIVEPGRQQLAIWRMRIACWIPKATNTLSEYVILIGFPLQQWLHERVLPYAAISSLVFRNFGECFVTIIRAVRHTNINTKRLWLHAVFGSPADMQSDFPSQKYV
jgi:hypothetical protein